ncbi:Glyoxylase, beta-lactamase superfamily II [Nakamurella panacisegetis]|uniref:Glyoxylase, beta-lactamase superfamily II n=1 Tax=Nakamurella panacisegetis TaxID=1090615 RepID=A0A1H0QSY2_9ACTN|nr:MBL fold metallo-hydrolase [Nakamurella panacisegetis]SDP20477.1 Glyoxylase, beta-lactamase superfamily II [Nakamurella panacisegetis]
MCPEAPVAPSSAGGLEVTGTTQHDAWWAKGWPPVELVRPGVWSVPVPVPDNPIRYTLCYLLFGDRELVVVDPGWDTDAAWAALEAGVTTAGASIGAITGVVITHAHPDHHGITARLAAASGAWIGMHPAERDSLPTHAYPAGTVAASDARWISEQGVPDELADALRMSEGGIDTFRAMAEPTVLISDGDRIALAGREIRAVFTPGHTPGHLCLHDVDNDLLLTGDHILPRISPNVGLQPHSAAPPLGPYLNSLRRLLGYDSAEVLPAHEWRFRGARRRIEQLLAHHEDRCEEILTVMADLGPCTSWQVTERLSWSRGWVNVTGFQRRAALAETIAHLAYLFQMARIDRAVPDDDDLAGGAATVYTARG